jgi:hypothetical protein
MEECILSHMEDAEAAGQNTISMGLGRVQISATF